VYDDSALRFHMSQWPLEDRRRVDLTVLLTRAAHEELNGRRAFAGPHLVELMNYTVGLRWVVLCACTADAAPASARQTE
jgi:hypothetical protein